MKVTWYGNATVAVTAGDSSVLFDPFLSPEGPDAEALKQYKTIMLTHENEAYMEGLKDILTEESLIYTSAAGAVKLLELGVCGDQIRILQQGDLKEFGPLQVVALKGRSLLYGEEDLTLLDKIRRLKDHGKEDKGNPTFAFYVRGQGKRVMILGTQGIHGLSAYYSGIDLLICPFCGDKVMLEDSLNRVRPKKLLIHDCDAGNPPFQPGVDTRKLKRFMDQEYAEIKVAKPLGRKEYLI